MLVKQKIISTDCGISELNWSRPFFLEETLHRDVLLISKLQRWSSAGAELLMPPSLKSDSLGIAQKFIPSWGGDTAGVTDTGSCLSH